MANVIGVDVGSQSVKVVCVEESGRTLAVANRPLSMRHERNGWAEQSPQAWTDELAAAVGTIPPEQRVAVRAISVASQLDGVVPLDRRGAPLHDALIWLDRRATAQAKRLQDKVGIETLFRRTGLNADASHGAPKMMWLRDNCPDVWAETRQLASVGSYLHGWLTGAAVHDRAHASSTLLYDLAADRYDEELCAIADVDVATLPAIASAGTVAGTLASGVARQLGLPADCLVAVGTGDEHAASLAAGVLRPGVIADVTGTAEPVTAAATEIVLDDERLVETHAHAVDGLFLVENPGFASGASTLWLAERVLGVPQADVFELADQSPAGSEGVIYLPTLAGATTPRWNAAMRGSFAGLSMSHGREHLARAVLEGCCFALRDIVDRLAAMGLGGGEVRVVGGGARIDLWCRIKADVLGRPVHRVLTESATAVGAAVLAGVAVSLFGSIEEAVKLCVRLDHAPIEPDPTAAETYAAAYAAYRALFDAVEETVR